MTEMRFLSTNEATIWPEVLALFSDGDIVIVQSYSAKSLLERAIKRLRPDLVVTIQVAAAS